MKHFNHKVEFAPNILITITLNICDKGEKYLIQKGQRSISIKYPRLHYSHYQVKSIKWTQFPYSFNPTKRIPREECSANLKCHQNTVISTLG